MAEYNITPASQQPDSPTACVARLFPNESFAPAEENSKTQPDPTAQAGKDPADDVADAPLALTMGWARGQKVGSWITGYTTTWKDVVAHLMAEPPRAETTMDEFAALDEPQRKEAKCARGYQLPAQFTKLVSGSEPSYYRSLRCKQNIELVYAAKLDVELDKDGAERLAKDPNAPKGNASMDAIQASLEGFEVAMHPTRSSRPGNRRTRVYVPFEMGLAPKAAHRVCHWLCDRLEEAGIAVDRGSSTDVVRPAFLPTLDRNAEWNPRHIRGRPVVPADVPEDYSPPTKYRKATFVKAPEWEKVEVEDLNLPDDVKEVIREGAHVRDGVRHTSIYYVCCSMLGAGYDTDTVLRILADPAYGISDKVLDEWGHGNQKRGMEHVAQSVLPAAQETIKVTFEAVEGTIELLNDEERSEREIKAEENRLFDGLNEREQQRIREISDMPPTVYDRQRKDLAKELSFTRVATLDDLVSGCRALQAEASAPADGCGDAFRMADGLADRVLSMLSDVPLVHDADDIAYAIVTVNGHEETLPLGEKASARSQFRRYASYLVYSSLRTGMSEDVWAKVWAALCAKALHEGDEREVRLRTADHSGKYYIDLCSPDWSVVEVSATGWRIIPSAAAPVLFRRTSNMHPLPAPQPEGSIEPLWQHVNIPVPQRPLFLAILIAFLRASHPYPILALNGMEGSGKTTVARCTCELVDPKKAPTRALPHSTRDMMVGAHNNYLLAYENVSFLGDELSDGACRIATGSGSAERTLYDNLDETVAEYMRPIILEGIPFFLKNPDIIDRAVHFDIQKPEKTLSASELKLGFEAAKSGILGGLLSVFSNALAQLPDVKLDRDGIRMMDFALLGQAVYQVLDVQYEQGRPVDFSEHLDQIQRETRVRAMEASPVLHEVIKYMRGRYKDALKADPKAESVRWDGTPSKLLESLSPPLMNRTPDGWPRSGKGMADVLARHRKPLAEAGIDIRRHGHTPEGTLYTLMFTPTDQDRGNMKDDKL